MNTSTRPTLTREDRQALLSHILATVPAEGRTLSGVIAGQTCESSANQREAYHKASERALRQMRKGVAA